MQFAKQWKRLSKAILYLPERDRAKVKRAFEYSARAHSGLKRDSGHPYFFHPFEATLILASYKMDSASLCAELLHDVLEETPALKADLAKRFGKEVAELVAGVTKLKGPRLRKTDKSLSKLHNLFLHGVKDKRVVLVKFADKLHNMRTLHYLAPKKAKRIALDCLQFYSPLAEKLGMQEAGYELEDLALKGLDAKAYRSLKHSVRPFALSKQRELFKMARVLRPKLPNHTGIEIVSTSLYSLHEKMRQSKKPLNALNDFAVLYLYPPTVPACYEALGVLHSLYPPVPKKFKDYIALPKTPSYQALHSTVIGPNGKTVKAHVLTPEMREVSRQGIAYCFSHHNAKSKELWKRFSKWFDELARLQSHDSKSFVSNLEKRFSDSIVVFSKSGEVFELSKGSTVLDFAFFMSRTLGIRAKSATVNGKPAPLGAEPESGDRIVIERSPTPCVQSNWMELVHTESAQKAVHRFLQKHKGKIARAETVHLVIDCEDRPGILALVSTKIASYRINIAKVAFVAKGTTAQLKFSLNVSPSILSKLVKDLSSLPGIERVSLQSATV